MSICTQHTFLWQLKNHFIKMQQAKWEPIQATVSQKYALMELLTNDRSVIMFYRSCDYILYLP